MKSAIRAEFIKLFSVRATYALLTVSLLITALLGFYVFGYRVSNVFVPPTFLSEAATTVVALTSLFVVLAGALLVTNEYRHNTILYSMTATNQRLKLLLGKAIVVTVFAVVTTLLIAGLGALLAYAGVTLRGADISAQSVDMFSLLWRVAFYGWAYAMLALLLAFIIRNQVGVIITLVVLATILETIMTLLLRDNAVYLPFRALGYVLGGESSSGFAGPSLSPGDAAVVVLLYLAVGTAVAGFLLRKRDAA